MRKPEELVGLPGVAGRVNRRGFVDLTLTCLYLSEHLLFTYNARTSVVYIIDLHPEIYGSHGWNQHRRFRVIIIYYRFSCGADRIYTRHLNQRESAVFTSGRWSPGSAGKSETYTISVRRSADGLEQKDLFTKYVQSDRTRYQVAVRGGVRRVSQSRPCGTSMPSFGERKRPGISESLERFWELSREYPYSWEFGERPGISVSLERFLETSREYPYSRKFRGRDRESPCLLSGFWKRGGNIRTRGNSEKTRISCP